ncbi:squalene/phytoene synthase family protein [Streptomyces sp. NPDC127068]|uniref:squalene/phytoene synthase family protein n=1 Tax=Streptomyces sp. NPDC127068 TaxID=3347127 RepID=UPI00365A6B10
MRHDLRTAEAAGGNPPLRSAYRVCCGVTRRDPAEYALVQLLPAALRPPYWALWAAASTVDDLADAPGEPFESRAARVAEWKTALRREREVGSSPDPVRAALIDTAARWGLDLSELDGAIRVVQEDMVGRRLTNWHAWEQWNGDGQLPWFEQVIRVMLRAGIVVLPGTANFNAFPELVCGVRLSDILTDLSEDLAGGHLLLPESELASTPAPRTTCFD